MKAINENTIHNFAFVNDKLINGKIRGVIVDFLGFGRQDSYTDAPSESIRFAQQGLLHIVPYYNPWCWFNEDSYRYTLQLLDCLNRIYNIRNLPIVACGFSMGGMAALDFAARYKPTVKAVVTNCPVCDLELYYNAYPETQHTIYIAFGTNDEGFLDRVRSSSPMCLLNQMPHVPYTIFQCEDDQDVIKADHSDRLVANLRALGHSVDYISVPNSGHCQLNSHYQNMYLRKIEESF